MKTSPRNLLYLATHLAICLSCAAVTPGDLDSNFGIGGKVTTDFGGGASSARALAIQSNGKIVTAGNSGSGDFALVRYNGDGSLDTGFGTNGLVTTDIGLFDMASAVAIQTNGKIVAAGSTCPEGYCSQIALACFNADGSLDTSFGTNGMITTSLGGLTGASALAIQADGKIVAAGSSYSPFADVSVVVRYNADGSLDLGFGAGGIVTNDFGGVDSANGVTIQADGKIVIAGGGGPSSDFVVARYNIDGTLDPGFGAGGIVTTDFGALDSAGGVALQPDGKIVAVGSGNERFALARYNADGSLDASFGSGGKVTTRFFGENIEGAAGVALQANGKIVVLGSVYTSYHQKFAVVRYQTDGVLDASFGNCGLAMADFGEVGGGENPLRVAIQTDGKIVAVGGAGACIPSCLFALVRFQGDPNAIQGQPPVAKCKHVTVAADGSCLASASIDDGSFDSDEGDTITVIQCPPGPYPLGETQVALAVIDSQGASDTASATVTVIDTSLPIITCPSDVSVPATSLAGAVVMYPMPTVSDYCIVTVTSTPPSGAMLPIGETTITCTATDSSGNSSSCTFMVRVRGVNDQLSDLMTEIGSLGIDPRLATKLSVQVGKVGPKITAGKTRSACKQLAKFIKAVIKRYTKGELTMEQADALIADAYGIALLTGCLSE